MIDVIHDKCIECKEIRISNIKYKKHCLRCFVYKYPEIEISKNFKIKERYVTDFLKDKFNNFDLNFDKIVKNGCSKRRPDAYLDLIEIDEYQHFSYEKICENKRLMELFIDFGKRPVVLIRFNPDFYYVGSKKIQSSFIIHKTLGIPVIRDKNEWNYRLVILIYQKKK